MFDLENICPKNVKSLDFLEADTTNVDKITVSFIDKQSSVVTILSKDGSSFKETHTGMDKITMDKFVNNTVRKFNNGELNEQTTHDANLVLDKAKAEGRFDITDKNSTFYYN